MDLTPISMNLTGNSSISPPQPTKKKRRVSSNSLAARRAEAAPNASAKQHLPLPPSLGYNDTMIASNPFDDNIPQTTNNSMAGGPPPQYRSSISQTNSQISNPMQCNNNMDFMIPPMNGHGIEAIMNRRNFSNGLTANIPQFPTDMAHGHTMFGPMGNRPHPSRIVDPRIDAGMNMNHINGNPTANVPGSLTHSVNRNQMNLGPMNLSNGSLLFHPRQPRAMNRPESMPVSDINPMVPPGAMMHNANDFRHPMNFAPDNMNSKVPHYQCDPRFNTRPMSELPPSLIGKLPGSGLHPGGSILQSHLMRSRMENPKPAMISGMEKVFPPNQPMIFNDRNPNAPPTAPCGICHTEVHGIDQGVFCESGCNFWYHRRCAGLTEAAYEMLLREPYAEWTCDKCLQTKNIPLVKIKP